MRYVAAYLLLALGGNSNPTVKDIKSLLSTVGIEVDDARAKRVVDEMKGQDVEEVVSKGSEKLTSVPSGAPAAGGVSAAADGGSAAPAAAGELKF